MIILYPIIYVVNEDWEGAIVTQKSINKIIKNLLLLTILLCFSQHECKKAKMDN